MKRIITALVSCGALVTIGCGGMESMAPEVDSINQELPVAVLWKCTADCTKGANCNNCGNKKLKVKWVDCAKAHAVVNGCDPVAVKDGSGLCTATYGAGSIATTASCSLLRPITLCELPNGGGSGDPHMVTFGGVRYEFQGLGEYVMATDNETYSVHVRMQQWGTTQTTVQTAVAARVGETKVGIYANETPAFRINDQPAFFSCPNQPIPNGTLCSGRIDFDGGGWVSYDASQKTFKIYMPDDVSHFDVALKGGYMNTQFFTGPAIQANTVGLLGTANGNAKDDFMTRDGRVLAQPLPFRDTYNTFGSTWKVSDLESLFTYQPGRTTLDYTDAAFPRNAQTAADLPSQTRDAALTQCRAAGVPADRLDECTLDAAVLGIEAITDFVHVGGKF